MAIKQLNIFLVSFLLSTLALADAVTQSYQDGRFGDAVQQWEDLARSTSNGDVFYNLGNAYFKNNQPGQAVAAYIAAQSLKPRDPDIAANLKFVRDKVGDNLENSYERPSWQRLFCLDGTLNLREQFWVATNLLILALFVGGARWWLPRGREALTVAGSIFLLGAVWLGFGASLRLSSSMVIGAVTVPAAEVRAEKASSSSPVLFQLSAGTPVRILDAKDSWVRVALPDGKGGWLQRSEVAYFTL